MKNMSKLNEMSRSIYGLRFLKMLIALFPYCHLLVYNGALAASAPTLPYYDYGACPYEGCRYNTDIVAKEATVAYKNPSKKSAVGFAIERGDFLKSLTGLVITSKPRILEVIKPCTISEGIVAQRGDRIYYLSYLGEGFVKVWLNGKHIEIEWDKPQACTKVITEGEENEWWIQVVASSGTVGWVVPEKFHTYDEFGGGQYYSDANWLLLRRGENKLGYHFTKDNRINSNNEALSISLSESTSRILIAAGNPKFIATCWDNQISTPLPPGITIPPEMCNIHVTHGNSHELVEQIHPKMVPYIDGDYAIIYEDSPAPSQFYHMTSGNISILNLRTGISKVMELNLASQGEKQVIDTQSIVREGNSFLVNTYIGCPKEVQSCDMLYKRAYRLRIDPDNPRPTIVRSNTLASTNTITTSVQADPELDKLVQRLERQKRNLPAPPKYLYYDVGSLDGIIATVALDWSDRLNKMGGIPESRSSYEEFFLAASQYRSLTILSLRLAERALQAKSPQAAARYLDSADQYIKQFHLSEQGALAIYGGDLDSANTYAKSMWELYKFLAKLAVGPGGSVLVSSMFIGMDFIIDANDSELGLDEAARRAMQDSLQLIAFNVVQYPSLNGKTLSAAISDRVTVPMGHAIGKSPKLFDELVASPQFRSFIAKRSAQLTNEGVNKLIDRAATEWSKGIESLSLQPSL